MLLWQGSVKHWYMFRNVLLKTVSSFLKYSYQLVCRSLAKFAIALALLDIPLTFLSIVLAFKSITIVFTSTLLTLCSARFAIELALHWHSQTTCSGNFSALHCHCVNIVLALSTLFFGCLDVFFTIKDLTFFGLMFQVHMYI